MAVCRYMVTCPKWPECRHGGFTARDTLLPGSHRASPGIFPSVHRVSGHTETGCIPHHGHGVLGTASPPYLEQTLGGGSITPRMAAGTQDHPLRGGGVKSSLQADSQVRLPKSYSKTGTVL